MYKINFTFSKTGWMKYISHLDLMRLFARSMRRAGLPLKMTEGFSPHPKLSMNGALKLGAESNNEQAAITLRFPIETGEFITKLDEQLPEGIRIIYAQGNIN